MLRLLILVILFPGLAYAEVFTVSSANDGADVVLDGKCAALDGTCTLRAAIQEANATPGRDSITFAIGSGTQILALVSSLPEVDEPVVIDGSSQPGFVSAPLIVLDGQNTARTGLTIRGGNTWIRSLVIQNFFIAGIVLQGSGGNVIEGCYIGTDSMGTGAAGNGRDGVLIEDSANNLIGGPTLEARNVISANLGTGNYGGIRISGQWASENTIQGNYIGTDVTGMRALGNRGRGIAISGAPNNLVGGPMEGAGNLISANRATGVRILGAGAEGNVVEGNWIGVDAEGKAGLANDRGVQARTPNNEILRNVIIGNRNDGVALGEDATHTFIEGNVIAFNGYGPRFDPVEAGYSGVLVQQGTSHTLRSNHIFGNALLGISLGWKRRPTLNDLGDVDTGPNELQNYPVLTAASGVGNALDVAGVLNSHANSTFTVEFYSSPSCGVLGFGQGLFPLGERIVTTDFEGNVEFAYELEAAVPSGWVITALATDDAGNTSEFSSCVTVF